MQTPERKREYQRIYYYQRLRLDPAFKERHAALNRTSRAKLVARRRQVIDGFRANGCALCDEKEPCCMSAHHLDPQSKDFSIGGRTSISIERLERELKKCVCLCENCHRKVHAGVLSLPEPARSEAA